MSLIPFGGQTPRIHPAAFVAPGAQLIGDIELGPESSVWYNCVLRGDVNRIRVGKCSNVQDLTMCHVSHKMPQKPEGSPLLIGDFVTIGHSVILHGCAIGNECLIGMGSIIMDDVIVPDQVMIGAGSLVPPGKKLESGMLYVGQPVKAIRALTPEEVSYLKYSAEHYVRVKNNYLTAQS